MTVLPFHRARRASGMLLLSVVGSVPLIATNCSRAPVAPATARRTRADSASQKLFGLRAPMTHNGVSHGILSADSAFVYEDGMRLELRGVRATLEGPTGLGLGTMTAQSGVVTIADSRVTLRGTVEVTNTTGRQLQSSQVIYDLTENRLRGDSAYSVRANKSARPTAGVGFVAVPGLARILSAADFLKEQTAAAQRAAKAAADSAARKARAKARAGPTAISKPASTRLPSNTQGNRS